MALALIATDTSFLSPSAGSRNGPSPFWLKSVSLAVRLAVFLTRSYVAVTSKLPPALPPWVSLPANFADLGLLRRHPHVEVRRRAEAAQLVLAELAR